MRSDDFLQKFTQQLSHFIGPGIESMSAEIRQQIRTSAQAAFEKMDFVPREEFEAQKAVLLRSREKLEQLEKQFTELNTRLNTSDLEE